MTDDLTYPIAENHPERVRGASGKAFAEITLDSVLEGETGIADLRIAPEALRQQAAIARQAGRDKLAENFERAAEMTALPQEELMAIYDLLRPGRAKSGEALRAAAEKLERDYAAPRLAALIREAASVYERRGLFKFRF